MKPAREVLLIIIASQYFNQIKPIFMYKNASHTLCSLKRFIIKNKRNHLFLIFFFYYPDCSEPKRMVNIVHCFFVNWHKQVINK